MECIRADSHSHYTGYKLDKCKCEKCREANRVACRAYYRKRPEVYLVGLRSRRRERMAYIDAYKSARGCSICGWNEHPVALDLHHVDGEKSFTISQSQGQNCSMKKLSEELEKCIVLCSNCHRIITWRNE